MTWKHFSEGEIIDGMERFLDDGTALNVIRYRDSDEWHWMIRIWEEDAERYSITASYDYDRFFLYADEAYDDLCGYLKRQMPWAIERDDISQNEVKARNGFAQKMIAVGLAAALTIATLAGCSTEAPFHGVDVIGSTIADENGYSAAQAFDALYRANEIVVDKDFINFGDHWVVYADGEHVADITGEALKLWDVYTMRSSNGEVMCSEEENLSLITSDATKFDANGNPDGHYTQNISFFLLDMTFYDDYGNTIGTLHQDLGVTLQLDVKAPDGTVAYHASKDFISFGARITLEKVNDTEVAPEDAIFGTVIANELSEASSSSSSGGSSNRSK